MPAVNNVLVVGAGAAGSAAAIHLASAGVAVDLIEIKPDVSGPRIRHHRCRATRFASCARSACGTGPGRGLLFRRPRAPRSRPDRHACSPSSPAAQTGGPTSPPRWACRGPELAGSSSTAPRRAASWSDTRPRPPTCRRTTPASTSPSRDATDRPVRPPPSGRTASVRGPAGLSASTSVRSPSAWGSGARSAAPADVIRTDLVPRWPRLHRRLLPDRGELALRLSSSRTPMTAPTLSPEEQLATLKELSRRVPRPVGRHPRDAGPTRVGSTTRGSRPTSWTRRGTAARAVLIGDAVHTCPPTIAHGVGQALEDAAVLAELLLARSYPWTSSSGTTSTPAGTSAPRP